MLVLVRSVLLDLRERLVLRELGGAMSCGGGDDDGCWQIGAV